MTGVARTLSGGVSLPRVGLGGVISVMVLNAFPKRNREKMDAGVPALKLAHLPSRPGAVERSVPSSLSSELLCAQYHTIATALPFCDNWGGPSDSVQQLACAVLEQSTIGQRLIWGTNALG